MWPAKKRRYSETLVFVPFYGGAQPQLKRHVDFVNALGFDAFTFDLYSKSILFKYPMSFDGQVGLKHLYTDQVEKVLNHISGLKIVYAFSNPAASAIEAMSRRSCYEISGLVCDSGPARKVLASIYNLIFDKESRRGIRKTLLSPALAIGWSWKFHNDLPGHLDRFPKGFKILSVRGWKDQLIPPEQIDAVFEPHPLLDWRKLSLPQAGHLNGLRDFESDYKPGVESFLKEIATSFAR